MVVDWKKDQTKHMNQLSVLLILGLCKESKIFGFSPKKKTTVTLLLNGLTMLLSLR